jgi:hypothetical protein
MASGRQCNTPSASRQPRWRRTPPPDRRPAPAAASAPAVAAPHAPTAGPTRPPRRVQITELRDRQRPSRPQKLPPAAHRGGLVVEQVDRRCAADDIEPAGPQAQPLGIHHRHRPPALAQLPQLPGGHRGPRLGQVDPNRQTGRADRAGRLDQDSTGAAGHIEDAHAVADAGQGQQPLGHLVEEPNLVIAGGDPAKQADDALLGLLHVHPTYRRLTAQSSLVTAAKHTPRAVWRTVRHAARPWDSSPCPRVRT